MKKDFIGDGMSYHQVSSWTWSRVVAISIEEIDDGIRKVDFFVVGVWVLESLKSFELSRIGGKSYDLNLKSVGWC